MIYLDSAATSLEKPPAVAKNAAWAVSHLSSPGRGAHNSAMLAAETAYRVREKAAQFFHVKNPENVVLTFNATHGLNIAIKSIVVPGDKVIISGYEHNSVTRPLRAAGARVTVAVAELFEPEMLVHAFEIRLTKDTALVVLNHVSNVFGYIQPAERIAALCQERKIPFILDASQSAGTVNVDFSAMSPAFVAMPGHKGLYGPQGTGLLLCGRSPQTLLEGGTGGNSVIQEMPDFLPDRLEAGTHNMPGIAGLAAGLDFVQKKGPEKILEHEKELISIARDGLNAMERVHVFAQEDPYCQSGVLSFILRDVPCEAVAEELSKRDIAVRAGLHCAPLAHRTAETIDTGTVRISVSAFTTKRDIHGFLNAMEEILAALH